MSKNQNTEKTTQKDVQKRYQQELKTYQKQCEKTNRLLKKSKAA